MTIVATIQNLTGGLAPATSLGVFLSPSSNTPGAGVRIGLVAIPSLTGGASYTASAPVTVPLDLAAGDHFLSAMADVLGAATEEVETNNGLTAAAQVAVVIVQPDLVVSTITGPVSMPRGKPVAIPMTVRNLGPVASGPYRVGVFVSESARSHGRRDDRHSARASPTCRAGARRQRSGDHVDHAAGGAAAGHVLGLGRRRSESRHVRAERDQQRVHVVHRHQGRSAR